MYWPPLGAFIKPPALRVVHDLQGSPPPAWLQGRSTWDPERPSEFEGHPEGAWWAALGRMVPSPTALGGGHTVPCKIMRQPADGARAGGSDRDEAHGIPLVLRQQACQLMGRGLHMAGLRGAHKGGVKRRDASQEQPSPVVTDGVGALR